MTQSDLNSELLILAIETATRAGSVAVSKGARTLASDVGDASVSHSAHLITMIQKVLDQAGSELPDIDLIAASSGPGSFTGLRIGLATAKALANCTEKRVIGISTLAAIAYASGASGELVALLPAGRGEVFAQKFFVEQGSVQSRDAAAHLSPQSLLEKYGATLRLTWAGEGAIQQSEALQEWSNANGSGWTIIQTGNHDLAPAIAALALVEDRAGNSATAAELRAVYVRASDAEINEKWQQPRAQQ